MKWKPHKYMLTAVSWLLMRRCGGYFLDPGLGKTSISLSVMRIRQLTGRSKGILVIAPLNVVHLVWPAERAKWQGFRRLRIVTIHGTKTAKAKALRQKADIYLINPEGLKWLYNEMFVLFKDGGKSPFNTLWIDESTKFGNPTAKSRFKLLVDMLPLFPYRVIMTGTLVHGGYLRLWSQIYILDKGKRLGPDFYRYRSKYFACHDQFNYELREGSKEKIDALISDIMLRMDETLLDMPRKVYNVVPVELPPRARKKYDILQRKLFMGLENDPDVTAASNLQLRQLCHQVSNGRVYETYPEDLTKKEKREFRKTRKIFTVHRAKIAALQDLIDELNGKNVMVAYYYQHDLEALQEAFGADLPYIGKRVKARRVKELTDAWNAGEIPVLACSPGSIAHGANLQEGGVDVIYYSLIDSLDNYDQFLRRVYRQGVQGDIVRIHHLVATDTVDEMLYSRLGEKYKLHISLTRALLDYRKRQLAKR